MGYSVRVTKCYLVQVIDDEGNEVSCDYDFRSQNKEEAKNTTGKYLVQRVQEAEAELCKCGYCDCIFNTEKYKGVCERCVDGSEYDDEDK